MEIWYLTASIKHCTIFLYSQNDWESLVLTSLSQIILVGDIELSWSSTEFFSSFFSFFPHREKINQTCRGILYSVFWVGALKLRPN